MSDLNFSLAEQVRSLPHDERVARFEGLDPKLRVKLAYDWRFWARPNQLAPVINPRTGKDDWVTWVLRAGRGFGKTRAGAGWVQERAMAQAGRWIALVARTPADARDNMILGPGGLLKTTAPDERPEYIPSNRMLRWPNGSHATIYSDEVPDQLRGFSGDSAWIDEFGKFEHPQDTWDNLVFGMRETSTDRPRKLITTTPRPIRTLKQIEAMDTTVVTVASSYDNRANLDPTFFHELMRYEGTRLGRQEIHAEIVDDLPGALWTRAMLDRCRLTTGVPVDLVRIVVAVDPSGTQQEYDETNPNANEVGIIVAGLGTDGLAYVLSDFSNNLSPANWGRRVVEAYTAYQADRIVAEKNFGGAMVEHVIRTAEPSAPVKLLWASRGKIARAEPVAALYEQGKVKHVLTQRGSLKSNPFDRLEDQLCAMLPEGYAEKGSPDRADALVWAITELMIQKRFSNTSDFLGLPVTG